MVLWKKVERNLQQIAAVTPIEPVKYSARSGYIYMFINIYLLYVILLYVKAVTGLSSISLARSATKTIPGNARVYSGKNCEWIDLNKVHTLIKKPVRYICNFYVKSNSIRIFKLVYL